MPSHFVTFIQINFLFAVRKTRPIVRKLTTRDRNIWWWVQLLHTLHITEIDTKERRYLKLFKCSIFLAFIQLYSVVCLLLFEIVLCVIFPKCQLFFGFNVFWSLWSVCMTNWVTFNYINSIQYWKIHFVCFTFRLLVIKKKKKNQITFFQFKQNSNGYLFDRR